MERQIDKDLGTTFKNDSNLYGAVRYYDGGQRHVQIAPCQNITDISLVDTSTVSVATIGSDTYTTYPDDSNVKRMISMRFGRLPRGFNNVKVTADFTEYGAEEGGVPSDIQLICTRVVASLLSNNTVSELGVKRESVEGHEVMYDATIRPFEDDPIVKDLMDARKIPLVDVGPFSNLGEEAEDTLGIY